MKTIRQLLDLARANPGLAMFALTIDATIGIVVGGVVYILLNTTDVTFTNAMVLILSTLLAVGGLINFALAKSMHYMGMQNWGDSE